MLGHEGNSEAEDSYLGGRQGHRCDWHRLAQRAKTHMPVCLPLHRVAAFLCGAAVETSHQDRRPVQHAMGTETACTWQTQREEREGFANMTRADCG
jgi:hypothetical protein